MSKIEGSIPQVIPGSSLLQPNLFPSDAFSSSGVGTATPVLTLLDPWQMSLAKASGANLLPVGGILMWPMITAPTGFLLCDGSSVLRASYAALFAILTRTATVTITIASPGVVTWTGHGLATGDCISFETTGALPTGLTVSTNYWVIYVDTDTFRVATTLANARAGTAINTSGSQSGVHTGRHNPFGIADATHFSLPNYKGISPTGVGAQDISARTKTGPALGEVREDQGQGHWHRVEGVVANDGSTTPYMISGNYPVGAGDKTGTGAAPTSWADDFVRAAVTDTVNGTPRTGAYTHGPEIGINFVIKY